MPMKASVISDRTAKITVPTKPEAMTAVRFGRISNGMIRQVRLAGGPGRLDVVAPAQRQRLGAQHPRAPGPRGEADDQGDHQVARRPGASSATMMISGSAGITRKTLDSADRLSSAAPPRKPDADADQDRQRGRDDAGEQADEHHAAGADEHLAEDVLAEVRRAEPVLAGRRLEQCRCCAPRVVRRDPRADDREQAEEAEDDQAGRGLAVGDEPQPAALGRRRPRRRAVRADRGDRWLVGADIVSPPSGCGGRAAGRRRRRSGSRPAPTA